MEVFDGWVNVFRLADDEPVESPDELTLGVAAFFAADPMEWRTTTTADLLRAMKDAGAARGLLTCSQGQPTGGAGLNFSLVRGLAACAQAQDRLRLVYQLDDVSSPAAVAGLVSGALEHPEVVAIGVFPSMLGLDLDDRRLYPVYAICAQRGIPVRINVGVPGPRWRARHQHPMLLDELLIDFPDLVVVAAHMGHPWESLVIRLMMKYENLHLMTSGYSAKYFDQAVTSFMASSRGRGRVMYASDFPIMSMTRALREARALPLDAEALEQFLGAALARVVPWDR